MQSTACGGANQRQHSKKTSWAGRAKSGEGEAPVWIRYGGKQVLRRRRGGAGTHNRDASLPEGGGGMREIFFRKGGGSGTKISGGSFEDNQKLLAKSRNKEISRQG